MSGGKGASVNSVERLLVPGRQVGHRSDASQPGDHSTRPPEEVVADTPDDEEVDEGDAVEHVATDLVDGEHAQQRARAFVVTSALPHQLRVQLLLLFPNLLHHAL